MGERRTERINKHESANGRDVPASWGNAACGRAAVTATCSDVPLEAADRELKPLQVKGS